MVATRSCWCTTTSSPTAPSCPGRPISGWRTSRPTWQEPSCSGTTDSAEWILYLNWFCFHSILIKKWHNKMGDGPFREFFSPHVFEQCLPTLSRWPVEELYGQQFTRTVLWAAKLVDATTVNITSCNSVLEVSGSVLSFRFANFCHLPLGIFGLELWRGCQGWLATLICMVIDLAKR